MSYIPALELYGAFFNRTRGGWLKDGSNGEGTAILKHGKAINAVAFALIAWMCTDSFVIGFLSGAGMFAGQSLGWGRYIGALGGWEDEELREVGFIDAVIAWLRPTGTPMFVANPGEPQRYRYADIRRLMAWGFAGLTLRGLVWAVCLALPISAYMIYNGQNPTGAVAAVLFVGACMGLVYGSAIHTYKYHPLAQNPRGLGWQGGEFYFGALIYGVYGLVFF